MSLDGAIPELDAAIARLEQLDGVAERAAPAAARNLEAVARAQWAAGVAPDGQAWPADKRSSSVPLAGLTARITFATEGATIVATGPDELAPHQQGSARLPARPTFPAGDELPPAWRAPIEDAIREELERG